MVVFVKLQMLEKPIQCKGNVLFHYPSFRRYSALFRVQKSPAPFSLLSKTKKRTLKLLERDLRDFNIQQAFAGDGVIEEDFGARFQRDPHRMSRAGNGMNRSTAALMSHSEGSLQF